MRSIVYIVSDINKSLAFEWISESLEKLNYSISFILLNPGDSELEHFLKVSGIRVERVACDGKLDWIKATWRVKNILVKWNPQIVHCHLLAAGIIGLTAARFSGIKNRIYTRHHSTQHHIYHRRGIWLDRYCNTMATRVIAASKLVKRILVEWENVAFDKVVLIPHGFRLEQFSKVNEEKYNDFRQRNDLLAGRPVIGVISRFIELKGVQYIVPAFHRFCEKYPNSILLLLNAKGDYEQEIKNELSKLPTKNYRCIDFESDIYSVYPSMDIFLHVPIDEHSEAFGQIYVESLAAGVPSIFTLSGISPDFILDEINALVVPFRNSDAIYEAMVRLWENENLRMRLSKNGLISVQEKFDLSVMIHALDNLYQKCLSTR